MKVFTLSQAEARGYFRNNTRSVVIEFMLKDEEAPLVITGERGRPVSNNQAIKYLNMLTEDQKFTNRSVTDFGYQDFLFENFDSRKGEYRLGFMRWIPEGRSQDVVVRITECRDAGEAQTVSKIYRATKLSKNRTMRRDVPVADHTARRVSMIKPRDTYVFSGTARNVALKAA